MLFEIFFNKKLDKPYTSISLILTCFFVWIATLIDSDIWPVFATHSSPIYFWQYFSGIFQHSFYPRWFYTIHFWVNMSIIVLFGVLIERIIGLKKFLLLNIFAGISGLLFFYLTHRHVESGAYFNGISILGWSYAPVVCMILLQLYRIDKNIIREKMFIVMTFELILMWVIITLIDLFGNNTSNSYHLIASLVGLVFTIIYRKDIIQIIGKKLISKSCDQNYKYKKKGILIGLVSLLPLGALFIIGFYIFTGLNKMFVNVTYISPCNSIEEINNNESKIEIGFDSAFLEKGITSINFNLNTATKIGYDISYSIDRTKVIISFDALLQEGTKGKININEGRFINHKELRNLEISFE